ncbi:hypothetical protein MAFF212519_05210 [Clavibacter michiganensis]
MVVLEEEDLRGLEARGEDERLAHVALAGGAVAVVGDDRGVAGGIPRGDVAVERDAHRVARRVQRLRADDQRVEVEVARRRIPAAVRDAAHEAHDVDRVDAADERDAVLAVGGEHVVLRARGPTGSDLRRLLPGARRPEAEVALALEVRGLEVERPREAHVAEEAAVVVLRESLEVREELLCGVARCELARGGQELDRHIAFRHRPNLPARRVALRQPPDNSRRRVQ